MSPKTKPLYFRPQMGENGSITAFSLISLVGMIGICGLAVDAMYFEGKRVAAQDALDRCALMAAVAQNRIDGETVTGTPNTTKAKEIATDCMAKSTAGSTGLNTPTVLSANSERSVTLSASYTYKGLFPFINYNATIVGTTTKSPKLEEAASKTYAITSQATQKLPNLELTVAVDTNHAAFWTSFKEPLKTFLNTVSAPDTGNKVTINFVPFDRNVHLGEMIDRFDTTLEPPFEGNANRTCMLLPEDSKDDLGVDMDETYRWSWPVYLGNELNPTSMSFSFNTNYISGHPSRNGGTWASGGEMTILRGKTYTPPSLFRAAQRRYQNQNTAAANIHRLPTAPWLVCK